MVDGNTTWLTLTPRDPASSYQAIDIGFDEQGLRGMRLRDNLRQLTAITFAAIARNAIVAPDAFEFTPPAGVDIMTNSKRALPDG